MAWTTDRVMKPSEWEQLGLTLRREKRSRRTGNPQGLDVREILPRPAEGEKCLLTSPSIELFHLRLINKEVVGAAGKRAGPAALLGLRGL